MDNFQIAMDFIMAPERDGHQNDSAPTENFRTSWGITQQTWDNAISHGIVSGKLEDATQEQCKAIYKANYWNALQCDQLPPKTAIAAFVDATLMGVRHVARLLQRLGGVTQDGVVGEHTIQAAWCKFDFSKFIDADEEYLKTLPNAETYIRGWTNREEALRTLIEKV